MRRTLAVFIVASLALLLPLTAMAANGDNLTINTQKPRQIHLAIGKSTLIDSRTDIKRVSLAAPEIADTIVLSPRQIYVVGKGVGSTNLTLWGARGSLLDIVEIEVTPDLARLKEKLHHIMPDENIQVTATHDSITMSGYVSSTTRLTQALAMAEAYAPEKVINLMQVAGVHQVMLEVRVAEVSRSLGRRLGFNFSSVTDNGRAFGVQQLQQLTYRDSQHKLSTGTTFADTVIGASISAFFRFHAGDISWTTFIDALKENGLVKVMAEPTLVTMSGQESNFLAGGEFPIPVSQKDGVITIEYKSYGVGLVFKPTVLSQNRIGMVVTPEVSELDFSTAFQSGGVAVPGITTRRASTTIELGDGQSFAIAGLLNDNTREVIQKFPILGDIPIIGALFRSSSFQKNETELVIIVTPHLVKPLDMAKQTLPTDQFVEPNDFDFFLMGRTEGLRRTHADGQNASLHLLNREGGLDGNFGYMKP
jgi:pilus assembly protein CpaC